jgi:hypothetical protein
MKAVMYSDTERCFVNRMERIVELIGDIELSFAKWARPQFIRFKGFRETKNIQTMLFPKILTEYLYFDNDPVTVFTLEPKDCSNLPKTDDRHVRDRSATDC